MAGREEPEQRGGGREQVCVRQGGGGGAKGCGQGRSGRLEPVVGDGRLNASRLAGGRRSAFIVDSLQVTGAHREPFQADDAPALEDAVDDGPGRVVVVQGRAPVLERLVGGEQVAAVLDAAGVDEMEQDVGCVGAIAEVADFVAA